MDNLLQGNQAKSLTRFWRLTYFMQNDDTLQCRTEHPKGLQKRITPFTQVNSCQLHTTIQIPFPTAGWSLFKDPITSTN